MKFPLKTLLLVWLMFVAIQASAQTTSATLPRRIENEIIINKMPIKDFGRYVAEKVDKDKVDLNAPFVVEFESVLNFDGKLNTYSSKFTKTEGDAKLIEIVRNGIAAISDSGYLIYLEKIGNKKGFVSIQQDKDNFSVSIKTELESEQNAMKMASAFKLLLQMAKTQKARQHDENDKYDLILLENSSVKSEGKFLMLNFVMPQSVKQELINKKLNELRMNNY